MNAPAAPHNTLPGGIAPIGTLDVVEIALEALLRRHANIAGLGVLYGPPGRGKSMAAGAMVSAHRAYYIQVRRVWSAKVVLQKILLEMGVVEPRGATAADLLDLITAQLARSGRPLILDEADYLLRSDSLIETVRDIYEGARQPVMLVGTDQLRTGLRRYPQMHSRVYQWVEAAPVTFDDARKLATIYAPFVTITDDLLQALVDNVDGSVRYAAINLARISEEAMIYGMDPVDLAAWGDRGFYSEDSEGATA